MKSPVASLCLVCSSVRKRVSVTISVLIFSWATGAISPLFLDISGVLCWRGFAVVEAGMTRIESGVAYAGRVGSQIFKLSTSIPNKRRAGAMDTSGTIGRISYFRNNNKSCFRSTSSAPPQSPSIASAVHNCLRKDREDPVPSDSSSIQYVETREFS